MCKIKLIHQRAAKLNNSQYKGWNVLVLYAETDDDNADKHANAKTCVINDV